MYGLRFSAQDIPLRGMDGSVVHNSADLRQAAEN